MPDQFPFFVGAEGPDSAEVAIVAEKGAVDEVYYKRPMVGTTGSMIRRHARKAGLDAGVGYRDQSSDRGRRSKSVWLTNAVHHFPDPQANPTAADLIREQPRLYKELCSLPNLKVIMACGAHALASLTNFKFVNPINLNSQSVETQITSRRGSRYQTPWGCKVVATLHPSFYVQGEWRYQPIVQFDFNRLAEELAYGPTLALPKRDYYIRPKSLSEAVSWLHTIIQHPLTEYISFDIETVRGRNGTWYISCIAFSDHPSRAFCIPIMQRSRKPYWESLTDEAVIWRKIQDILDLADRRYVTQNGHAFDCFQLYKHRILTPWMQNGFDTYSAHSLLAPDLPHDLGFLVSIYTGEQWYKDESGKIEGAPPPEDQYWVYNCKDSACTLEVAWGIMADMKEHSCAKHNA